MINRGRRLSCKHGWSHDTKPSKMPPLTFYEDREFLFLKHLHSDQDKQDKGITSLFVLKTIAFSGHST